MGTLLLLGFVLSLDSFRVSLGLGALKLSRLRHVQIVLAFGLCDGLAPLVGLLIGKSLVTYIGWWTEYLGPLALCAYGAYVIYVAKRCAGEEARESGPWIVLGLPLSMSLDNLIAGASLGMVGFPLLISVAVIGSMSALMSLAGLRLGSLAVSFLRINTELVGGVALVLIALVLAIENF
ncbi:MAG TPA: manganese efflux pump [Pyrinomonadaceae bacterium]|nr:manganese efflux pump [Pyrinomonadaceae bacterium]